MTSGRWMGQGEWWQVDRWMVHSEFWMVSGIWCVVASG